MAASPKCLSLAVAGGPDSALKEPPTRFAAGADAVQTFEAKANALLAQAHAHHELSTALAHDNA